MKQDANFRLPIDKTALRQLEIENRQLKSNWAYVSEPALRAVEGRPFLPTQYFTIAPNDFGSRLAPPTSAPPISSSAMSALAFSGFTEPPYKMRRLSAKAWPKAFAASPRISKCATDASCGVAVLPVPMAQTGSYARTSLGPLLAGITLDGRRHFPRRTASRRPRLRASRTFRTDTLGPRPGAHDG